MIERRITRAILKVLQASEGYMLPEDILLAECDLRLVPPATPEVVRENLQLCIGQGWVRKDVDVYQRNKYWITDAGKIEAVS